MMKMIPISALVVFISGFPGNVTAEDRYATAEELGLMKGFPPISADSPSSPMSNVGILNQIYGAVTFKSTLQPPEVSEPFPPGAEHLTLEQAIKAVTIGPARQLRMEDKLGSIEVGKLADLVILERNNMDLESPEELLETEVLATMVDGVIRHRDGI